MIRLLSLFTGIGAFEKALKMLNIPYELVGFSEIDKFAVKSYCAIHNVDENKNLGDVKNIKTENLKEVDFMTWGFPCQDVSIAGNLKGIEEGKTRSGLYFEGYRILKDVMPKVSIIENVKNINYEKAQKIIHRKTLEVKKEPIELSKDEINQLVNKYKKTYKKGRMVFAGILSTFLWGMIVSLLDIFIGAYVGQNFKPEAIIPVLLGGLIIFIIGSILIIKFFLNIPVKRIKKFKYRSEFLVYNWKRDFNVKGVADSHIIGGSFDGNICKELVYGIWHNDISFIEGVENLEIVYRYSKSKYPNNLEYCLFVRKNII